MKWVDPAWSPNYYAGANNVQGIVIHHAATTSLAAVAATFSTTARQASAHYGVDLEYVQQYVHEYDGAWHAGDYWANTHTIGIENVNSTLGPNWYVDERTVETCCELMADIAIRYDLYPLKRYTNVWGHKDFQSTYCPGVLYDRLDYMCDRANKIAYDKMHGEEPEVVTNEDINKIAEACAAKVAESAYWDEDKKAQWGPEGKGKGGYYRNSYNVMRLVHDLLVKVNGKIDALAAKVDKMSVGNVDYKARAKAVNDDAANRMKS